MRKYLLEITVFLCGALGMILELVAARVLSPYIGSSNLVWTTIIGVMLISMSIGYWLGGKLADKKPSANQLSVLILIGALFTSLISVFETIVVKQLAQVTDNLVLIAFVASAIVFGMPSFVLATVSPFAVKLKDKQHENIGKTSGKISSLSTIGSITGTFLAGFFLIPTFGIRTIIVIVTILLIVLSILLFENKSKKYFFGMVIVTITLGLIVWQGKILFDKYNPDIIEDVDSQYSRIWIKDFKAGEVSYKTMQVDNAIESYLNQETNEMGAEYLYYYDLFDYFNKDAQKTLMIGGAAYTYPTYYLKKYENRKIDVSEIDETMTELAEKEFGLDRNNERLQIYHQDGRSFLNYTKNQYDCILIDAFKGLNAPFELTTYEALKQAYNKLNNHGVVITNIISALEGNESDFIAYEYATYKKVFDDVKVYQVKDKNIEEKQNLILIGFKGEKNIDETKQKEYQKLLDKEIENFVSDKPMVTDNYAPIGN